MTKLTEDVPSALFLPSTNSSAVLMRNCKLSQFDRNSPFHSKCTSLFQHMDISHHDLTKERQELVFSFKKNTNKAKNEKC